MTGHAIAGSRPLRALVALLWIWAGGRAAYELTPFVRMTSDTPTPATVAARAKVLPVQKSEKMLPERMSIVTAATRTKPVAIAPPQIRDLPPAMAMANNTASLPASEAMPSPTPQGWVAPRETSPPPEKASLLWPDRPQPMSPSLSAWMLVRDGGGGLAPAGTLGGAQAGFRFNLPVTRSIAATARVSTPLRTSGAEASVGVALRRGPVALFLERRFGLERGGRNDFSATLVAGVGQMRLPKGFRLDAYGQLGVVGRDGFADGAVRVERRILSRGRTELSLGAGIWGGAQPGIARLDIGPQAVLRTPIAGGTLRASGEWRQRIAGHAQPASGPAITIGIDF